VQVGTISEGAQCDAVTAHLAAMPPAGTREQWREFGELPSYSTGVRAGYNLAVVQVDRAISIVRKAWIVRHDADGSTLMVQFPQLVHHLAPLCRVEVTRRLTWPIAGPFPP
jgi:hypothetical protein